MVRIFKFLELKKVPLVLQPFVKQKPRTKSEERVNYSKQVHCDQDVLN